MEKDIKFSYWLLFKSTFIVSMFTVGGGYVIIPLLKAKFVDEFASNEKGFTVIIKVWSPDRLSVESTDFHHFDNIDDALKYDSEVKASGILHNSTIADKSTKSRIFYRNLSGVEFYYDNEDNDISREEFIKIYGGTVEPVRRIGSFAKASYVNTLVDIITNLDPKYRSWGIHKIKNAANLKGFNDVRDVAQKVLDEGLDSFTVGDYINLTA